MEKVSIIIPTFNEEKTIANVINKIKNIINSSYEVIVIDDGSKDKTLEILNKIKDIKIINNPYNLGYGASIKKGIKESTGDLILIIDGDGTYPTNVIPKLLNYKNYDMVVGARIKKNVNIPLLRKPAKWIITKLANFLSGKKILDLNSGLRVFKKNIALNFFHLFPSGFSFTTTLTLACLINDYTIKYVPIEYYKRKGKSSINPIKDFINFITLIFKLIIYFKPLKIFFLISIILFIIATIFFLYSFFFSEKIMDITIIVILLSSLQIFLFGVLAELMIKKNIMK